MVGKKIIYGIIGLVATFFGVLGVWLPGLPTVPFILVALWAFSNSSKRLHNWFIKIPLLRSGIEQAQLFQEKSAIPLKTKIIAQCCAWASFLLVAITLYQKNIWIVAVVGCSALACTIFMILTPTEPIVHPEKVKS